MSARKIYFFDLNALTPTQIPKPMIIAAINANKKMT